MITVAVIAQILETVIVPVFIVIAAGFLLQKLAPVESTASVSSIILHTFTPCLVFISIISSSFESDAWWKICFIAIVSILALVVLSWAVSKALRLTKKSTAAFVLSTSFLNAGNYGLPLTLFAFGEKGLALAVIFFVASSLLTFTVGVFVASQGSHGLRESVKNVVRLPLIYSILAAAAVRLSGFTIPKPILQGVGLMGQAAIPAMLIVLGMELARSTFRESSSKDWTLIGFSSVIKLLFPILFVSLLSGMIGLTGLAGKVALVQASMPTAVFVVIITLKYGGNSRFVTNAVVVSTLASVVTLTLLLSILL